MKELLFQSKRCVISRVRFMERFELVSEDGEIIKTTENILENAKDRFDGVVPSIVSFALRPRSFLTDLRLRRDIDMGKRIKAKRQASTPRVPGQLRTKRTSIKNQAESAAASLPFDLSAILKGMKNAKV